MLEDSGGAWWDGFFADRSQACPLFVEWPDENLAEWFSQSLLAPGRVLELGCGNGRNATYLAGLGCAVDAVDFSARAIEWAQDRARHAGASVTFQRCSIFDAEIPAGSYDLVYDSGCFHHLFPDRRQSYGDLVQRALRPGGSYGLVCFRPEGGSGYTDQQVYERGSLGGGLGYEACPGHARRGRARVRGWTGASLRGAPGWQGAGQAGTGRARVAGERVRRGRGRPGRPGGG